MKRLESRISRTKVESLKTNQYGAFPPLFADSSLENTVGQSNGRPMHASSSFGNQESRLDDFPGVLSQDYLRQLRREVVELVKQQPGSALPLAKFIPAFHAQFGKQCCVADYGYSRLQDLIDALKGIVHTVGEGPLRMIMLTHVIQVRRFTHDILRLLKSEPKKSVPIGQLPRIYEQAFHKVRPFNIHPMCINLHFHEVCDHLFINQCS